MKVKNAVHSNFGFNFGIKQEEQSSFVYKNFPFENALEHIQQIIVQGSNAHEIALTVIKSQTSICSLYVYGFFFNLPLIL